MSHLAHDNADVILIHKSGCLSMNTMYHFILCLLLSPNFFWMFNLLSNSSTLSRMSDLVCPYLILTMCMIHFFILSSSSSESFVGGPFFHVIGIFPFSLSHVVDFRISQNSAALQINIPLQQAFTASLALFSVQSQCSLFGI